MVPRLGTPVPPGVPGRAGEPARPGTLYRQLARFLAVGVASTLAYVLLYLGLRTGLPAQPANAISLLATALLNTAVNRRFTFGIRGRPDLARHQAQGLLAFGAGLALTSGALAALHAVAAHPARATEVTVLVLANLLATAIRFVIYRHWVFRRRGAPATLRTPAAAPSNEPTRHGAATGAVPAATVLTFHTKNGQH